MTPETLFSLGNMLALPGWVILILAPRRWPALNAVPLCVLPGLLAALYSGLVLTHFAEAGGGYGSIAEVRQLFASDAVLTAGWLHYLAFDLFVGAVLAARMDAVGVGRVVQAFILPTIFLFGPAGMFFALATETAVRFSTKLPMPERI